MGDTVFLPLKAIQSSLGVSVGGSHPSLYQESNRLELHLGAGSRDGFQS